MESEQSQEEGKKTRETQKMTGEALTAAKRFGEGTWAGELEPPTTPTGQGQRPG